MVRSKNLEDEGVIYVGSVGSRQNLKFFILRHKCFRLFPKT